jgi:hypothetical protein
MSSARRRPRANKFGAVKTVVDGITFDSIAESERYKDLKHLEKAGKISNLRLQVPFIIIPSVELDGKKTQPNKYIADFVYFDTNKNCEVTEDLKGFKTAEYKMKRKLMKYFHNIEVLETSARRSRR